MTELSPTAHQLLEKFKREHGILTKHWGNDYAEPWTAARKDETVIGTTEIEAVRALCRQINILCTI